MTQPAHIMRPVPHVPPGGAEGILACWGLSKSFGGIEVLAQISLGLAVGEIHAVIGENGAGKSTLMRLFSGHLQPSRGVLHLDGFPVRFLDPADAERHGIVLIPQEITLASHLTVAQNIFLGREIYRGWRLDDHQMEQRAHECLEWLGIDLSARSKVASLSIAQRQYVQMARALIEPHRIVIFDEPTASLSSLEAETLLDVIRSIRARGVGVLYISHRLEEVKAIADHITILRDGRKVLSQPASTLSLADMARHMVGRDMAHFFPAKVFPPELPMVWQAEDIQVPGHVENAQFHIFPGEIVGFSGLIGAGRTELFEALVGLRPYTGTTRIDGVPRRFANPDQAQRAGFVYISEDRQQKGLLLDKDLRLNLTLAGLDQFCIGPLIDQRREWQSLFQALKDYDIRIRDPYTDAGHLSGGNQQKLLLARAMICNPRVIIFDEISRGIDLATKVQLYHFIAALAAVDIAVIVISSELWELVGLCHRIMVMRNGQIAGQLSGDEISEHALALLATGAGDFEAHPS